MHIFTAGDQIISDSTFFLLFFVCVLLLITRS